MVQPYIITFVEFYIISIGPLSKLPLKLRNSKSFDVRYRKTDVLMSNNLSNLLNAKAIGVADLVVIVNADYSKLYVYISDVWV